MGDEPRILPFFRNSACMIFFEEIFCGKFVFFIQKTYKLRPKNVQTSVQSSREKELQARFKVEILGYVSFVRIPRESGDTRHDW